MLTTSDHGRVRLLTFDRPGALNAMNNDLYWAAADGLTAAADDPGVAVVVFTGNGRAFCAGNDMSEMGGGNSSTVSAGRGNGFGAFTDGLISYRKPVVAAVNGLAVGIGFTMLAHCDLVLVAESARLKAPFPTLGVAPEAASSVSFPVVMGQQTAAYYLFTAEWMSAEAAVACGLAWKVVADDALLPDALALAGKIAAMPIPSLVETKQLMVAGRVDALMAARARENDAFGRLIGAPANREAIAAFLEKRPADFTSLPEV